MAGLVLVTGASGFLASHIVRLLLNQGYLVRGTVRSLTNAKKVDPIRALDKNGHLELVEGDITNATGWDKILHGCDYVLHVASPFPMVADESVITVAVNGTLNVLKAAAATPSVKKVVVTSSGIAVYGGRDEPKHVYDEKDWADLTSDSIGFYPKSKTLAEKAAWDFVKNNNGHKFALTVINPTWICGPPVTDEQGTSVALLRQLLNHELEKVPKTQLVTVDVRDVATCHVEALKKKETDGERIISASATVYYKEIAGYLDKEFGPQGYKITTDEYTDDEVIAAAAKGSTDAQRMLPRLGKTFYVDNSKAKKIFGLNFRTPEESLIEMAYMMIEKGHVKKTPGYKGVPARLTNLTELLH